MWSQRSVGCLLIVAPIASACWDSNQPSRAKPVTAGQAALDAAVPAAPLVFTPGHLTFEVQTKPSGAGGFAPRNAVAIWIEEVDGTPVKVLGLWAGIQRARLPHFSEAFPPVRLDPGFLVDAVTKASVPTHDLRKVEWNATDKDGNTVPDGEYAVMVELVDNHEFSLFTSLPFTKGEEPVTLDRPETAEFGPMALAYEPL